MSKQAIRFRRVMPTRQDIRAGINLRELSTEYKRFGKVSR